MSAVNYTPPPVSQSSALQRLNYCTEESLSE